MSTLIAELPEEAASRVGTRTAEILFPDEISRMVAVLESTHPLRQEPGDMRLIALGLLDFQEGTCDRVVETDFALELSDSARDETGEFCIFEVAFADFYPHWPVGFPGGNSCGDGEEGREGGGDFCPVCVALSLSPCFANGTDGTA